jgi:hypothetical protein
VRIERQRIWDILLNNFRIVVSAYAVLADALGHGFVTMDRIELLVFDEGKSVMYAVRSELIRNSSPSCSGPSSEQDHGRLLPSVAAFCVFWGGVEGGGGSIDPRLDLRVPLFLPMPFMTALV